MPDERALSKLDRQVEKLLHSLERIRLDEYVQYLDDHRRQFRVNFLAGLARGLGTAIGFTVLGAAVVVLLQHVVVANIPLIGSFLAEVVKVVNARL